MSRKNLAVLVAALALMMTAACSSGGGLGDILGGGSSNANSEIRGRVDYVDSASNYVVLTNVSGAGNMLSSSNNGVRVYYDANTPVSYNGQTYRPADLERGDEVSVQVDQSGNNLYARSMTVLHDASPGNNNPTTSGGGIYNDAVVRGTVRHVDTSRRTIEVERFNGGRAVVDYDNNTYVTFNRQNYRVADLERGDEIEIRVNDLGGGRMAARDIVVTRSISAGNNNSGTWGNNHASTIRGTVRYVDTSRREIGLESANWISRFNTGAGGNLGSTVVIQYDNNTSVEVNGQLHPVNGLERGDVIEAQVSSSGNTSTYFTNRIVLVRDVRR